MPQIGRPHRAQLPHSKAVCRQASMGAILALVRDGMRMSTLHETHVVVSCADMQLQDPIRCELPAHVSASDGSQSMPRRRVIVSTAGVNAGATQKAPAYPTAAVAGNPLALPSQGVYLTTESSKAAVRAFRYRGEDRSLLYKYALSPLAEFCVTRLTPLWIA